MGTKPSALKLPWIVALTSAAYFMVVLDATIVVTALPRMQSDLHVGLDSVQWTVNAYGIAFAAGIIVAAALGDRFGRRRVFTSGLALFTVASAACALAPNINTLIAARTVQGVGAAVVLPLSLTILTAAFPPERRGMIVGIYGGLAGLAVAIGPLAGGAITEGLNWHWVFWVNVPIGCAASVLGVLLLQESYGPAKPLDAVGVSVLTGGVVAWVWALTRANDVGWASGEVVGCLLAGAALIAAFIAWERSTTYPMIPLRLFAIRDFSLGNLITFLMNGATFGAAFYVTQEYQLARGYSPIGAGLRLLPFFATPMFISPVAGALSDRLGRRRVMVTGLVLQATGYTWLTLHAQLSTSWVELSLSLLVAGVGVSIALPTVPTTVLNSVSFDELGTASGVNYMAARFGTVFAVAIGGALFAAHGHLGSPASVTAGFRPAVWTCAVFAIIAALAGCGLSSRSSAPAPAGEDVAVAVAA